MYVKNITFLDINNAVIKCCKITSMPITEVSILSKCIEFFNDPEPCFIHRSAVINRIVTEMDDYFYNITKQGIYEINWSDFPNEFREVLENIRNVNSIKLII